MKRRLLRILICLLLAAWALPGAVPAETGQSTVIDAVFVQITPPAEGRTPDPSPTVSPAESCVVTGVRWQYRSKDMPGFEDMPADTAFRTDWRYSVAVTLTAAEGCVFSEQAICWINGMLPDEKHMDKEKAELLFLFPLLDPRAWDEPIGAISFRVDAPAVAEQPGHAVTEDTGFYSSPGDQHWFELDDGGNRVRELGGSDRFEPNRQYALEVNAWTYGGTVFAEDVVRHVTVGDVQAEVVLSGDRHELTAVAVFPKLPDVKLLQELNITVTAPLGEAYPVFSLSTDTPLINPYPTVPELEELGMVNSVAWYDGKYPLRPADTFVTGTRYTVRVCLLVDESCFLTDDFQVRINGLVPESVEYTKDLSALSVTVGMKAQSPRVLASIAIITPPAKTQYREGELFDRGGMVVTAAYSDRTTARVTDYTVYPEWLGRNDRSVTIYYTYENVTKTAVQAVTVLPPRTPASLNVEKAPNKTQYREGERFDPTGMLVTVTYQDRSVVPVGSYTVTPEKLNPWDKRVFLSYTENGVTVSATQAVRVKAVLKNPFVDVFESDRFYDAVLWAYYAEPQVTNGIDATHFDPSGTVTRDQAVTFLWRAMGCPEPKTAKSPFQDVTPEKYYYKAVLWAAEKGITIGTDETHFTPDQTCSTAHVFTFLYRTLGIGADGWYADAETWAGKAGLLEGLDIRVAPGVDCPRADVVTFLYRMLAR